jgi:hypothetical protein
VQLEPGMLGEPGRHAFVFVGGVVVQNHMNRKAFGYFAIECQLVPLSVATKETKKAA